MRIIIAVVLVLILALGGVWYYKARMVKPPARWETAKVDRGAIVAKVTATGSLSALVTVQVGSQVSGRIGQLFVDFNSNVKKGQILAKIDAQLFVASLEMAKANYAASHANLLRANVQAEDADRIYVRDKDLAEKKMVAQADLDTAKATRDAAFAQIDAEAGAVKQAKAMLDQAQVNLGYATIISPIDGTVISRNVDVGQTVAASLQAPTLFTIAEDLRRMQVDTSVAEADVGKLSPDMEASFAVDAYPNEKFVGKVRQIRNSPQVLQNVVTYDAVIDVANDDLKLKPGMTANVTFVYAQKDGVLRVPNAALRFHPPASVAGANGEKPGAAAQAGGRQGKGQGAGGQAAKSKDQTKRTVWTLADDKPKSIDVRTGISDGMFTEVLEDGLHEGDTVITDTLETKSSSSQGPGGPGMRRMF